MDFRDETRVCNEICYTDLPTPFFASNSLGPACTDPSDIPSLLFFIQFVYCFKGLYKEMSLTEPARGRKIGHVHGGHVMSYATCGTNGLRRHEIQL